MTPHGKETEMGQPVVHFEVVGKDGPRLRNYYSELFGWKINADNPMNYGMVDGKDNKTTDGGDGIGGGVGEVPDRDEGHVPFYVPGADVEAGRQKDGGLGGTRVMGPEDIMGMVVLGQFKDPEGNTVGVVMDQS